MEKAHKITKTNSCVSTECVNRFIEIGTTGIVCLNCQAELKKFVDKIRERERESKINNSLSLSRKGLTLNKKSYERTNSNRN